MSETQNEVPETTALSKPMDEEMLSRGREVSENIMDSIHTLKVYNAPPDGEEDLSLAGTFLIKNKETDGKFVVFDKSFKANILKVRKCINGSYPERDENGTIIKDGENPRMAFAFTEEYGRFTSNTDRILFKNVDQVITIELGQLKQMIKEPMVGGQINRFYKKMLKNKTNEEYNGSFLSDRFVIYGAFMDGIYKGEIFRLFLTKKSFGSTRDGVKKMKVDPDVGTFEQASSEGFKVFKKYKEDNNLKGTFDDSLLVMDINVVKDGKFKAEFANVDLVRESNRDNFDMITGIMEEHKAKTFNVTDKSYGRIEGAESETVGKLASPQATVKQSTVVEEKEIPVVLTNTESKVVDTVVESDDEDISIENIPF